jgi:hypothetical protein
MQAKYTPLHTGGYECHIFLEGSWILKVYKWFLLKGLSLEHEKSLWKNQKKRLDVYAPDLESTEMAFSSGGYRISDFNSSKIFCCGLRIRKGVPLVEEKWKNAASSERINWAKKIGEKLAFYHKTSPRLPNPYYKNPRLLYNGVGEVCKILVANRGDHTFIPSMCTIVQTKLPHLRSLEESANQRFLTLVHGDLNLDNIVLKNNRIQFIDPGTALPIGLKISTFAGIPFDTGWDLATLSASLNWFEGKKCSEKFMETYARECHLKMEELNSRKQYWQMLYFLMIAAVCLKHSKELSVSHNPIHHLLKYRDFSFPMYIDYYLASALQVLGALAQFPVLAKLLDNKK